MSNIKDLKLEKVVLNVGAGEVGAKVENAVTLLNRLSGSKSIKTKCKVRDPTWGLRPGLLIGAKVTVRGEKATSLLKQLLGAVDNRISKRSLSINGNFGFGISEYIDIPNVEYDPKIGIFGFDVCVKLSRAGERISRRKIRPSKVPMPQRITPDEAAKFMEDSFGVKIE